MREALLPCGIYSTGRRAARGGLGDGRAVPGLSPCARDRLWPTSRLGAGTSKALLRDAPGGIRAGWAAALPALRRGATPCYRRGSGRGRAGWLPLHGTRGPCHLPPDHVVDLELLRRAGELDAVLGEDRHQALTELLE